MITLSIFVFLSWAVAPLFMSIPRRWLPLFPVLWYSTPFVALAIYQLIN